jgi:hypothetical protein
VAVIPSPERKYKAKSIFGMLPWSGTMPLKLDMMEWLGVHWVRGINPQTEDINEYRRRGLEPIPNSGSMDKAPAGTFLFTEMENEPNFGTLAVEYAEKLKLNYLRQRKHDPNIAVGLAGIAGVDAAWVRELAENGCWDYLDLLHVHLHCFPYAPEVDRTISRYFWLASAVARLFPIMNEYGYKPLVDSEQGYLELDPDNRVESYPLSMVSREDMAAAFTVRSYLEGMAYGLLGKHWFTMMPYGGFGLIYQDTPRAAFSAYAAMTKLMDGAEYWGELINFESYQGEEKTGAPLVTWFGAATPQLEDDFLGTEQGDLAGEVDKALEPRLYQRVFKMQDGEPLLVAWATLRRTGVISERIDTLAWKDQSPGKSLAWDGTELKSEPEPLDIVINVGSPQVKVADLMGNMRTVDCPGGKLHLKVDDFPQYIYGAAKELLAVAHDHQYKRFPQEIKLTQGSEVVQLLLPPGGKFLRRKSVYDQENIAAKLVKGQPAAFTVRITNVSEKAAAGVIKLQLPAGWSSEPQEINFKAPAGQQIISEPFTVTPSGEGAFKLGSTVTVEGEKVGDSVMNVLVTAQ